ncbi:MAG: hypothetical protein AMS27_06365 [Bacteroides sp. SM23_62_1]|nr:MAG: hypothetical protein AMS27_06365 [Bacteroides sp. SM23_62_1]
MNSTYALFPIGILAFLLYILSYTLSRLSIITQKDHRQFWNILLLVTFLMTGLLGLTLAVQVNYKLNIPFIKELLVWHVDFGIGLTMIAVFHFLWHWDYYVRLVKGGDKEGEPDKQYIKEKLDGEPFMKIRFIHMIPAFSLGFTTIITQIILLREFMNVFYGNELVIGIVLTNWMILTAFGAGIGKKSKGLMKHINFQVYALILLSLVALVIVVLLNILKNIVFQPGSMVGIYQILLTSFILLMPFCLLSGYLFTYLSVSFSTYFNRNLIHRVYAIESIGSIAGGLVLSFILVYFLKSLQILSIVFLSNLILSWINREIRSSIRARWVISLVGVILIAVIFILNIDKLVKKALYPNQELVYLKDTPYGNLAVTKSADQLNFFENTSLLFTTEDPVTNEEDVHYALLQHPEPKNILIISGGLSGIIDEILKYDVENIDYVEINPWIVKLGRKWTNALDKEHVNVITRDPKLYLNTVNKKYDVILMQIPEPNTAQVNRYYTLEYFKLLKTRLNQHGLISLSLPSTINYVSVEANELNSIVFQTIHAVFENILIIPGNKNYLLASDNSLNINIPELVVQRNIQNVYVNQYYLEAGFLSERSNYIMEQLNPQAPVNLDFKPVCYIQHLKYWMSQFNIHYWFPLGLVIIAFLVSMIRLKPVQLGIFATGFAGSSIELLLILTFQILYGYVYHYTGVIITVFMGGLALGAFYREKYIKTSIWSFMVIQVIIMTYALALPFVFLIFSRIDLPGFLIHLIFAVLTLIISMATGLQFSLGSTILKEKLSVRAASLYSSDLLGSAFGALLVSVLLIPLLGIINSALIIAAINLVSAGITFLTRKNYIY